MGKPFLGISAIMAIFFSCEIRQSPLSDVPITDPGILAVSLEIQRIEFRGDTFQKIEANLQDKNEFPLSLLKGGLFINNIPMRLAHEDPARLYYYLNTMDLTLFPDSAYEFKVVLADSAEYKKIFRAPNISNLTLSSTFKPGGSLRAFWIYLASPRDSNMTATISNGYCGPRDVRFQRGYSVTLDQQSFTFRSDQLKNYESRNCISVGFAVSNRPPSDQHFRRYDCRLSYSFDQYLIY